LKQQRKEDNTEPKFLNEKTANFFFFKEQSFPEWIAQYIRLYNNKLD
jgi:hypothetical protein